MPLSDFAVIAQAGSFLVRYTDARNLGPQDFAITANAGTPSASTLHLQPNTTAAVSVAVPPGSTSVTLTATSGSMSRQATTTVTAPAPRPAVPAPEITVLPTGMWSRTKSGVRMRSMRMLGLPAGARVAVVCTPCHADTLTELRNKVLKRGQSFTVTVTKPGYIGERVTMTVRGGGFSSRRFSVPA